MQEKQEAHWTTGMAVAEADDIKMTVETVNNASPLVGGSNNPVSH